MELGSPKHLIRNEIQMHRRLTISIPKPCDQPWNNFSKTANGGFCGACRKEVIDFTWQSEGQILEFLRNDTQSRCGKFLPHQLKTYGIKKKKRNWLPGAITSAMLFAITWTNAQSPSSVEPTRMEQLRIKNTDNLKLHDEIITRDRITRVPLNGKFADVLQGKIGCYVLRQSAPERFWDRIKRLFQRSPAS